MKAVMTKTYLPTRTMGRTVGKLFTKKQWRKCVVDALMHPMQKLQIEQCCPYTFVVVKVRFADKFYRLIGFSKVRWPDVWDSQEGIDMAICRAVHKFARRIVNGDLPEQKYYSYEEYLRRERVSVLPLSA